MKPDERCHDSGKQVETTRLSVFSACGLDGYIATRAGGLDWLEFLSRNPILNGTSGTTGSNCNDGHVAPVTRLVTFVDVADDVADARRMSVSARHEAVLGNGRRVLLLDDRGWSGSGPPNIWAVTSVEEIVETARMVVGPDEPFGARSREGHGGRPLGPAD